MATKINVRSPFYINVTKPTEITPEFTCEKANVTNLTIDQQGQISTPNVSFGYVDSITSTDADFSNGKFATETSATTRVLTLRIIIPTGYSNSDDGYIDCSFSVVQPALSCSGGPTTSGSIPAQTLDSGGDSDTIDLTSYFTAGSDPIAGYNISNPNTKLVNASVSGDTLTLSSNAIAGSTSINVSAFDNGSGTCTATQTISVSVNASTTAFDCNIANLNGGSIAQDGTIVEPNSVGEITAIKSTSGGSTITSYSANTTGSDRSVTLYFDVTAPGGYSNAGATIECSKTFTQPAADPEFTCAIANLSGQQIATNGAVSIGSIEKGDIASYDTNVSGYPLQYPEVSTDTSRTITFTINVPSTGYSNSGSTIDCDVTVTQPAKIALCGSTGFYISAPKLNLSDFCDDVYPIKTPVTSSATSVLDATGVRICRNGSPFDGKGYYYAVAGNSSTSAGAGTGRFYAWNIDSNGIVQESVVMDCPADGSDSGNGRFGQI